MVSIVQLNDGSALVVEAEPYELAEELSHNGDSRTTLKLQSGEEFVVENASVLSVEPL